jgi:transglutaminase-like putative cysteine protease
MRQMRLRVGCEFQYETTWPTPAVMLVRPYDDDTHRIIHETWESEPAIAVHEYRDLYANRCQRLVLPAGTATLRYDAVVEVSGAPDEVDRQAVQVPVEDLPDDVLVYTLASRYCLSDALCDTAWRLFGETEPGWARVQAVCDWIHTNIQYGMKSTPLTTALDVFDA